MSVSLIFRTCREEGEEDVPKRFWIEARMELISLSALLCLIVPEIDVRRERRVRLCIEDLRSLISSCTWARRLDSGSVGKFSQYVRGLGVRELT